MLVTQAFQPGEALRFHPRYAYEWIARAYAEFWAGYPASPFESLATDVLQRLPRDLSPGIVGRLRALLVYPGPSPTLIKSLAERGLHVTVLEPCEEMGSLLGGGFAFFGRAAIQVRTETIEDHRDGAYDVVIAAPGPFIHCADESALDATCRALAERLRPGGTLVVECATGISASTIRVDSPHGASLSMTYSQPPPLGPGCFLATIRISQPFAQLENRVHIRVWKVETVRAALARHGIQLKDDAPDGSHFHQLLVGVRAPAS